MMLERSKSEDEDQVENDLEEKLLPENGEKGQEEALKDEVKELDPLEQIVQPLLEDERVKNEIERMKQEEEELEELVKQDAMNSAPPKDDQPAATEPPQIIEPVAEAP